MDMGRRVTMLKRDGGRVMPKHGPMAGPKTGNGMRKLGWLLAGVIITAIAGWVGLYHSRTGRWPDAPAMLAALGLGPSGAKPAPQTAPPAVPVEVAAVRRGRVALEINAVGTLRSNESVILRPEIAGRIADLRFKEGESVTRDTVLIAMDNTTARAELAQAKANLGLSQANFDRQRELARGGASSERARDEALAKFRADQASVDLMTARLEKYQIPAPFDGMLGLRRVSLGDFVAAGAELVNLEQIDPLKVDFRVPELYLGQIAQGQSVRILVDAFPGERFDGTVFAIDPLIDANGRAVVIRARIANPDQRLRPGLFARVVLTAADKSDALLIPEEAIVATARGFSVFIVAEGKAKAVPVRIGLRRDAMVEILDGVAEGQQVIVAGQAKPFLRDGVAVRIVPAANAAPVGEQTAPPAIKPQG